MKGSKISFVAEILKFGNKGEKTGWNYIEFSESRAQQLFPGNRKSFRIKGTIDKHKIRQVSLIPIGEGKFILPMNATIRKATGKKHGDKVALSVSLDNSELSMSNDLMACLNEEPLAMENFMKYAPSHRNYFSKWIESAKTEATKTKRIVLTINALLKGWNYAEMLRDSKK